MGLQAHAATCSCSTFYPSRTRDRRSGPYPVLTDWVAFPAPCHSPNFIFFFSLLRCTFIYVCACRSFCSWFWGRVLRGSGWSKTLNVNKADFRFIEICLPPQAYATAPSPAVYCTMCEQYPWKPEKGTSSPGTGVARICELPIRC